MDTQESIVNPKFHQYIALYLGWMLITLFALGIVFLVRISQRFFFLFLTSFGWQRGALGSLVDRKIIIIVAGLAFLGFIVGSGRYLRHGLYGGILPRRFLRIFGIEFLILFVLHGYIVLNTSNSPLFWVFVELLVVECVLGSLLTYFSFRSTPQQSSLANVEEG